MPFNARYLPPVCIALGLAWLVPGLWIAVAPHSFFAHIGPFGPYNPHFLLDPAAFQGGIGLGLLASARLESLRAGTLAIALAAVSLHAAARCIDFNAATCSADDDV